jgi:hypothetical protein
MNTLTQKGTMMVKTAFEFIKPILRDYPGETLLVCLILLNLWGYYDLQATDAGKADRDSVIELKTLLSEIRAEQKATAKYYTGKETFAEMPKLPPAEFLLGADSAAFMQPYDSCKKSPIPDLTTNREYWICFYHRFNKPDTFRIFWGK